MIDRIPADAVKLFSYDRRKPSDGTSPVDSAHGGGDLVNEAGEDASAHWDGVDPDLLDQVGIPSHCIQLKVGDIVMCMRNLATSDGLIVVKIHFKERLIECITLLYSQTPTASERAFSYQNSFLTGSTGRCY